jgi:hypothetical protein
MAVQRAFSEKLGIAEGLLKRLRSMTGGTDASDPVDEATFLA